MWRKNSLCTSANEDLATLAEYDPLTGYDPIDYHISETTEPYIQESSGENGFLNSHDLDYDDYTIGMALSSPLFTEREDAASRGRAYHSHDEGLSSSQSSSVGHRTVRPVVGQFDSLNLKRQKIRAAAQKMSKSGFFRNDKESRFSLIVKQRFKNTSSRSIMTVVVFKSWMKLSSLKEEKFIVLIEETKQADKINNFFMNNY